MKYDEIKFEVDSVNLTIEVSVARILVPHINVGSLLELKNVLNPKTGGIVNTTLRVVPDEVCGNS